MITRGREVPFSVINLSFDGLILIFNLSTIGHLKNTKRKGDT